MKEQEMKDTFTISASLGRGRELSDDDFYCFALGLDEEFSEEDLDRIRSIVSEQPWLAQLNRVQQNVLDGATSVSLHSSLHAAKVKGLNGLSHLMRYGQGLAKELGSSGRVMVAQLAFRPIAADATLSSGSQSFSAGPFAVSAGFNLSLGAKPAPLGQWHLTCLVEPSGDDVVVEGIPFRIELIIGEATTLLEGSTGTAVSALARIRSADPLQIFFEWIDRDNRN